MLLNTARDVGIHLGIFPNRPLSEVKGIKYVFTGNAAGQAANNK